MYYSKETYIKNLLTVFMFIFVPLLAIPAVLAASTGSLSEQVNELQASLTASNEKLAIITVNQQKASQVVSSMKSDLFFAHQEMSHLKAGGGGISKSETETGAELYRTANGHGRGGR